MSKGQARQSRILDLAARFEAEPLTSHPFLRQLSEEPVDLGRIWILLTNFQASISANFARWLANAAARVESDHIRCILAEQLNDEMGRGNIEKAHVKLFSEMMDRLAPWRPSWAVSDAFLKPARVALPKLQSLYGSSNPYVAVGAIVAGEIFGNQLDHFIGSQVRRQQRIDPTSLEWLTLHEALEEEHAASSVTLATLVPEEHDAATESGALALFDTAISFLNDVATVCSTGSAEKATSS